MNNLGELLQSAYKKYHSTESALLKVHNDLVTAKEKGILVYNTPDTPALAVAELTLSMMLNILVIFGRIKNI